MPANPVKQRPTAVIGSAVTLAGTVVVYLVSNGYIPADVMKRWGWLIVLVAVGAAFLLLWFHVVPEAKVTELRNQLEGGKIPDPDIIRVVEGVKDGVAELLNLDTAGRHAVGDAHPDAVTVGAPAVPTLTAGAPDAVTSPTDPTGA